MMYKDYYDVRGSSEEGDGDLLEGAAGGVMGEDEDEGGTPGVESGEEDDKWE